ncbi:MAG: DEAD/DEAH box helicase [candidate division Zixibacteria bacterium]|nr:DEAD/DEAH box helicase [candidate division Zixibacteria bacterium]MDH3937572.1 DEAD/DEAH box helicase [candidate division Zixibacteria bacterium]MDH4032261.1 DEAD/DEAH box helicase [candidate division Zixibacteria bacterium]
MTTEDTNYEDASPDALESKLARSLSAGAEHLVEPADSLPSTSMVDLPPQLRQAAARAGWTELTTVQARTIPYMLARRDLICQSRTGSGKTGAFVLPIMERIKNPGPTGQALILVPTRELAKQVGDEISLLAGNTGIRCVAVYGGVGYGPQIEAFRSGAQIVVGTPGRILDHLLKRTLSLDGLEILVFDEADRMMSMGFYPDMKQIQRYLPRRRINAYMFSATFPSHVIRLAGEFLRQPDFLSLSRDNVHVAETEHVFYVVPGMEKERCLVRVIEIENPTGAIVFCNTKATVGFVTTVLKRFGYDADELTADLTQRAREKIMTRVREHKLRFLVATDLAARGIDIPELSHIIQYEPPEDPELYVHRAGRTGRAGASGEAITLANVLEKAELQRIAKRFSIEMIERPLPTDDDVAAIAAQRVTALLEARLRARDKLQVERMQRFVPLAIELGQSEDEASVIAMLLDDYYQETLHAPPEQPSPAPPAPPEKSPKKDRPRKKTRSRSSKRR